jgi:hypothetical protein
VPAATDRAQIDPQLRGYPPPQVRHGSNIDRGIED